MFGNVLVGVDNREGGRDAIALSKQLLVGAGELTLAHVYAGDPHVYRGVSAQYEADERRRHLELLTSAVEETGVRARLRWCEASSAGRGLHALCEEIGADLLIVGSSRRGVLGRMLLGDDAREALARAPCAVGIAPAGYRLEPAVIRRIGVGDDGSAESRQALRVARDLAAERGSTLSVFEPLGKPAEELADYSAAIDLLVIGSHSSPPFQGLREATPQRLARTARCPLLVVAPAARRGTEH
jgi:nucleotide-binding universal stress UspA family protein